MRQSAGFPLNCLSGLQDIFLPLNLSFFSMNFLFDLLSNIMSFYGRARKTDHMSQAVKHDEQPQKCFMVSPVTSAVLCWFELRSSIGEGELGDI